MQPENARFDLILDNPNSEHQKKSQKKSPKKKPNFTYKIFCTKLYTNAFFPTRKCCITCMEVFHDSNTSIEIFLTSAPCTKPPNKSLVTFWLPCQKYVVPCIKERLSYINQNWFILFIWTCHSNLYLTLKILIMLHEKIIYGELI